MNEQLSNRNYALLIDKSGSMGRTVSPKDSRSRWKAAQESSEALARKCEQFDADGIDVIVFSDSHKHYPNVSSAKVEQVFLEQEPGGGTNLAGALKYTLDTLYFAKKEKPLTMLVITDGEPNSQDEATRVIIDASKKLDKDEELAISFLQVGDDVGATKFLIHLDDGLTAKGAKFDIVDTMTFDAMGDKTLTEVLLAAIED